MAKTNKIQELVATANAAALEAAATEVSNNSKAATKAKETAKAAAKEEPIKVEEPKAKKTTKKSAKVTASLVKEQNAAIVEKVVSNREVKYIYPEDIIEDPIKKKRWRQQVRNKLRELERDMNRIKDQNSKEYKTAKKEFENYQKQVLKPGQTA